jgi:hypothetical protein
MFQSKRDFNDECCEVRDLALIESHLQTFEQWVAEQKSRIPLS